ncbi:MAG: hypothetical protein ACE5FG_03185 [Myxococcota bacterium]
MLRAPIVLLALAAALSLGCVAIPVQREPLCEAGRCSRHQLVVGLFPGLGEAHMSGMGINGRRAGWSRRSAEKLFVPVLLSAYNLLALGMPTLQAWVREPWRDWATGPEDHVDPSTGKRDWVGCVPALFGFCKATRTWSLARPPEESGADASE